MDNDEILERTDDGKIINLSLSEKWKNYFDAEDELALVKKELIIESIRAKSLNHTILGISVVKGNTRSDSKAIDEIFKEKKWEIPQKPMKDNKAMVQKLKDEGITIPQTDVAPFIKRNKKKKKR